MLWCFSLLAKLGTMRWTGMEVRLADLEVERR